MGSSNMIRLAHPLPTSSGSKLSLFLRLLVCCRLPVELAYGRWGEGGTKLYDRENPWPSINHSILYAFTGRMTTLPDVNMSGQL